MWEKNTIEVVHRVGCWDAMLHCHLWMWVPAWLLILASCWDAHREGAGPGASRLLPNEKPALSPCFIFLFRISITFLLFISKVYFFKRHQGKSKMNHKTIYICKYVLVAIFLKCQTEVSKITIMKNWNWCYNLILNQKR